MKLEKSTIGKNGYKHTQTIIKTHLESIRHGPRQSPGGPLAGPLPPPHSGSLADQLIWAKFGRFLGVIGPKCAYKGV